MHETIQEELELLFRTTRANIELLLKDMRQKMMASIQEHQTLRLQAHLEELESRLHTLRLKCQRAQSLNEEAKELMQEMQEELEALQTSLEETKTNQKEAA